MDRFITLKDLIIKCLALECSNFHKLVTPIGPTFGKREICTGCVQRTKFCFQFEAGIKSVGIYSKSLRYGLRMFTQYVYA